MVEILSLSLVTLSLATSFISNFLFFFVQSELLNFSLVYVNVNDNNNGPS